MQASRRQLQVAERFAHAFGFADDPRARAVFVVGSSASGEADAHSDVDMMVVVTEVIPDAERLRRLRAVGCRHIMLNIAGVGNPALPVQSEVIDKFVFQDAWFDVSYHLPHQLQFYFDRVALFDKDGMEPHLCPPDCVSTATELKGRAQADLRLLRARVYRYEKYLQRGEWIGMDLSAIKNLVVDVVMVLNDRPNYNRHAARISRLLRDLPVKPPSFMQDLEDILHLDDRQEGARKLALLERMEAELLALCQARFGPIAMFDDEG